MIRIMRTAGLGWQGLIAAASIMMLVPALHAQNKASSDSQQIPWFEFAVRMDTFQSRAFSFSPSASFTSSLNACGSVVVCSQAVESQVYQPFGSTLAGGGNFGVRPSGHLHNRLQVDFSFEAVGAPDSRTASGVLVDSKGNVVSSASASARVWLLGIDGRFVQPLGKRLLFSVGGGPNYVSDKLTPNQNNVSQCEICVDNRTGWGPSGIAELTFLAHDVHKDGEWVAFGINSRVLRVDLGGVNGSTRQTIVMFGVSLSIQGYRR
jgi:hypothetical protein